MPAERLTLRKIKEILRLKWEMGVSNRAMARTCRVSHSTVANWHTRIPDPTLADAIMDRTFNNAYHLNLLGDFQRKLKGYRSMPHT